MSDQLTAVLNRCFFSSVLKLVRDEADHVLLSQIFVVTGWLPWQL